MIVATAVVLALLPLPHVIHAPATIRPAQRQSVHAPRDAVVSQLHVRHGQNIAAGDPLITLSSPELDQEITTLLGRRSVLQQQQDRWTSALVRRPDDLQQAIHVENQQRLVAEEIDSIDQQLALLQNIQESMTLRADQDGIVDAWQLHQQLKDRPIGRGDRLMNVVAKDSAWIVEAKIPQNRLAAIESASSRDKLAAFVFLDADPNQSWSAALSQFGPSNISGETNVAFTAATLELDGDKASLTGLRSGATARAVFNAATAR